MVDLNELSKITLETANNRMANGANIKTDTMSMLKHCAGEVVEATEAYGRLCSARNDFEDIGMEAKDADTSHFASELADIICCALIIAGKENIDIEKALLDCMERNRKRAEKQGDKL